MPYTNHPWSPTIPPGTIDARDLDDHIRQVRLDIQERLEDTLLVDLTTDPVVVRDEIKGAKTGIIRFIDYTLFNHGPASGAIPDISPDGFSRVQQDTGEVQASLSGIIPVGCVITGLFWLNDRGTSNTVTFTLRRADLASGARNTTVLDTIVVNSGATGFILRASNALNITIASDRYYFLQAVVSGGVGNSYTDLCGVRVVFNRPTVQEAT